MLVETRLTMGCKKVSRKTHHVFESSARQGISSRVEICAQLWDSRQAEMRPWLTILLSRPFRPSQDLLIGDYIRVRENQHSSIR